MAPRFLFFTGEPAVTLPLLKQRPLWAPVLSAITFDVTAGRMHRGRSAGDDFRGEGKHLVRSAGDIPRWDGIATMEPFFEGESVRILLLGDRGALFAKAPGGALAMRRPSSRSVLEPEVGLFHRPAPVVRNILGTEGGAHAQTPLHQADLDDARLVVPPHRRRHRRQDDGRADPPAHHDRPEDREVAHDPAHVPG